MEIVTASVEETIALGVKLGMQAKEGAVFCLFGELGSGKTTLIKGIAQAVTNVSEHDVSSPTFTYLNIYSSLHERALYHFDLYRLKDPEQFYALGFDEFLFASGVSCIEWSERLQGALPPSYISISLCAIDEHKRKITLVAYGKDSI